MEWSIVINLGSTIYILMSTLMQYCCNIAMCANKNKYFKECNLTLKIATIDLPHTQEANIQMNE